MSWESLVLGQTGAGEADLVDSLPLDDPSSSLLLSFGGVDTFVAVCSR